MAEETKNPQAAAEAAGNASPEAGATGPKAHPGADDKKAGKKPKGDAAKIAALEEKLATAEAKTAEAKDALLRTAAEYDNYRKRSQKENEVAFGNGVSHAALQMLPVLDTLEAAAVADTTDEEYKKGVLLTLQKCEEVFKALGITEIEAMGQPFDPELHNACMQEACEGVPCGNVTRVVQKGYKLNDRVIRHAMVAVAP